MLAEGDALFVEEEYAAAVDKYSEVREALHVSRQPHAQPHAPPHHHPHFNQYRAP